MTSRPPVASFNHRVRESNHPNKISFSAVSSYDPDEGDKISYSWDFDGDGNFELVNSDKIETSYTYPETGSYRVILQVEDDFNNVDRVEKVVTIESIFIRGYCFRASCRSGR